MAGRHDPGVLGARAHHPVVLARQQHHRRLGPGGREVVDPGREVPARLALDVDRDEVALDLAPPPLQPLPAGAQPAAEPVVDEPRRGRAVGVDVLEDGARARLLEVRHAGPPGRQRGALQLQRAGEVRAEHDVALPREGLEEGVVGLRELLRQVGEALVPGEHVGDRLRWHRTGRDDLADDRPQVRPLVGIEPVVLDPAPQRPLPSRRPEREVGARGLGRHHLHRPAERERPHQSTVGEGTLHLPRLARRREPTADGQVGVGAEDGHRRQRPDDLGRVGGAREQVLTAHPPGECLAPRHPQRHRTGPRISLASVSRQSWSSRALRSSKAADARDARDSTRCAKASRCRLRMK